MTNQHSGPLGEHTVLQLRPYPNEDIDHVSIPSPRYRQTNSNTLLDLHLVHSCVLFLVVVCWDLPVYAH